MAQPGCLLAFYQLVINPNCVKTRRKAVWGPKRTLAAAFVMTMAFATAGFAAPDHGHVRGASKARAGRPNSLAKGYKIDK
jgi:hypothetical protein